MLTANDLLAASTRNATNAQPANAKRNNAYKHAAESAPNLDVFLVQFRI